MDASVHPQSKPGRLYAHEDGCRRIRIRTLQYMNIIHLKRVLAGEVAEMRNSETTSAEQMEAIRKTLKHYGMVPY
jgi:hypothetical protein